MTHDASDESESKRHKKTKKHKHKSDDDIDDVTSDERRKKKSKHKDDHRSKPKTSSKSHREVQPWLRAHLRVRIIDEKLKKGRYYKTKVSVQNIEDGSESDIADVRLFFAVLHFCP